jgi:MoaA/NifB/PqqE/SkfB family radical SAM enzyme
MKPLDFVHSWGKILAGKIPILSIEITRECPLHCPGCYAYGDDHIGGGTLLKDVRDFKGDELVQRVFELVDRYQPLHVSLVGGEPLMRHRELSRILPELSRRRIFTMVVTSGVIPIPKDWVDLPHVLVAVSVDGLPRHHDVRREPATYERILRNIDARKVNIHWTIVRAHVEEPDYLEEYVSFWHNRPEVHKIWCSVYSPQRGESTPEMLSAAQRESLAESLPYLSKKYSKFLAPEGFARAFVNPPASPADCIFSRMSVNYTADLKTRVEPCVFGGDPDCAQCGCSASAALHWVGEMRVFAGLRVKHLVNGSMNIGAWVNRVTTGSREGLRWGDSVPSGSVESDLVQIK